MLISLEDENFPCLRRFAAWTTGLLSKRAIVFLAEDKMCELKYAHLAAT